MALPLLEVKRVSKVFQSGFLNNRKQPAVDDVSLLLPGSAPRTIALAGESGSGKTTLAQMILGFLPPSQGEILFEGRDVYGKHGQGANPTQYFQLVQAVFQNPFDAFNPFYPITHIFDLTIKHFNLARSAAEAKKLIVEVLQAVHLDPDEVAGRYPHQLSGGQLQRVMIARTLLLKPKLLIADEPVSMVDVSLRVTILDLLDELKNNYSISIIYITHDLSTAIQIADEILIMYQGGLVEAGEAVQVIRRPAHPYTQLLVRSIPIPDPDQKWSQPLDTAGEKVLELAGPNLPIGCKFSNRCPRRMEICQARRPVLIPVGEEQQAACYLYE